MRQEDRQGFAIGGRLPELIEYLNKYLARQNLSFLDAQNELPHFRCVQLSELRMQLHRALLSLQFHQFEKH